ncbi:MAG: amino acid adenylation domain-containing protein [Actinomadura rubrobrunea]|nr:amino acid adenylation domain-containing protein [Actinomadura rubrobrunea]
MHLDHQVVETPDGLYATWDAVEGLFPEPMLDEAFAAYEELLHRLADDEEAWTQSEPLLVSSGTALAEEVNRTEAPVPGGLLHEAVAERAAASPDAVAVVSGDVELTYADVVGRARRVGRVLRDLGVRPDELVAVCMEKGWEQVVAVLGVLESGAAYVPVDPALPEERRAHLFNTTRARYVLTQARVRDALSWPDAVQVLAVDEAEPWETVSDEPLQPAQRPDNLAYVIFTSGSTGLPKGVMIEHRAALNTIVDVNRRFGVGSGDRVLAVSSLSFDLSVWDVFGVLIAGGTMVMPRPGTSRDPDHWAELIAAHGVTVWNSVPALFELLVEQQAHAGGRALSGLRLAMLSGDWIPVRLPDRARQINPRLELISLGGATEASIWSIYHRIESVDPSLPSIPYGRPLANQTVDVLDHEFRPRPVHAVGRLYIGGVGLARGYWEDPDKTDAAFVACPRTGRRLYRTGDLGRRLPNGEIEFLGREDFQVKIGGHRIELGEIENTLVAHPAITAAVVNAHGDPKGPRRLVAYITTDLPKDDAEAEARRCAAEKLPEYMVPATIVILDRLPLTANGKVDRAALPDPDQAVAAADTTPPRTPAERLLHTIWSDLLGGRSDLGVHANLFDHGADSLLALRATAQADNHGLHLTLPEVFQHPTIAEQAAVTSGRVRQADQGQVSGPTGMTPSQLWFLSRNLPERHHWNDASFLLSLREPLDLDRLRVALRHVIEHHDGLRLRFREEDGTWRAHIAEARPDDPLPFTVHDLSHLDSRGQRDEVTAICDRLQTTLDLAEGPLLRVAYFDLGERPHCVLFIAHWLAVDHYSGRVVLEDLLSCYEALVPGSDPRLPAKTTSFPEWARLLSEHARSETVLAELDYWTSSARAEPDRVRLDRPEGRNDLASLENIVVRLDHDITEALVRRVQPQLGVDLAEVLSTVLARAVPLHHATGSKRRVLIDLERHGRDLELPGANPARTVGRLSTLAPVLVEVDADAQVDEAARDVARQLRAVPGQGAGYGLLRYLSDDPRARVLAEMPQAELGINYLGQVDEVFVRSDLLSVPRMSYGRQHSEVGDRVRVFDLQAYVVAGRFTLTFGYSRNLHRRDTADEIVAALTQGLTEIAAAADGGRA